MMNPTCLRHKTLFVLATGAFILTASPAWGRDSHGPEATAHSASSTSLPIMTLDPRNVCQGVKYLNAAGRETVGTKACEAVRCKNDGQTGCLTTAIYQALDTSDVKQEDLVVGYSLAGVSGTFNPNAPKPQPCTANARVGCIATAEYVAVDRRSLTAGNVVKGFSIGGVVTGAYPSASHPLNGYDASNHILQGANLATVLRKQGSLQFWDQNGERQVVAIDIGLDPRNIPVGTSIHGIQGAMKKDTFPTCSKDGQYNCLIRSGFMAVKNSLLIPENFRKDLTVGPIKGVYPSKDAALDGASDQVPDLTEGTFLTLIKDDAMFEYFDKTGKRYTQNGDSDLKSENISLAVSVLGVKGGFKGIGDASGIDPFDILKGTEVAGVQGKLDVNCASKGTCLDAYWQDQSVRDDGEATTCLNDPKQCVFSHKISGLTWYMPLTKNYVTWDSANSTCQGLSFKGHDDWRLPTQKEATQAMAQGMNKLAFHQHYTNNPDWGSAERFWTSTSSARGRAFFAPRKLLMNEEPAHNNISINVMCVR